MKYITLNECDFGSTGNIANDILLKFQKEGHTCYFANLKNKHKFDYSFHVYNGKIEYECSRVLEKIDGSDGFHNIGATNLLVNWLKREKPDVIHLHNLHGHWINLPILFKYLAQSNIKIIWTFHDCWPLTGRCAYFDLNGCMKWAKECKACKFKNSYPKTFFIDKSYYFHRIKKELFLSIKDKCTIITPSFWLHSLVKQSFFRTFSIKVINNGVDMNVYDDDSNTSNLIEQFHLSGKKIILSLAYPFGKRKGIDYIKKCIKHFLEAKDNKIFVLIGLNKSQILEFKKFSNCLPLGPIYDKKIIIKWYKTADIFLNPTLEDNFPTVTIEAMACGTPTIVFNSGGTGEPLKKFPYFVVERGSTQGLIERIEKISKNRNLSNKLIIESKKYSVENMVSQYYKVIKC